MGHLKMENQQISKILCAVIIATVLQNILIGQFRCCNVLQRQQIYGVMSMDNFQYLN